MESQFVPSFKVLATTDYPLRLSADSIIHIEILTRPNQHTDLDLPDRYRKLYGALRQHFAPLETPCYTLKDHALLGGRVLRIYNHVNRTSELPLCKTNYHYYGTPGIDVEFEDGRHCRRWTGGVESWPIPSSALASTTLLGYSDSEYFKGGKIRDFTLYHSLGCKSSSDSDFTKGMVLGTITTEWKNS